jgi:hypothetical protein
MQELIEAEAQDDHNLAIEPGHGAFGEEFDQMVETALPSEGADDDLGRERAIPFVGQPLPACG